MDISESTAARRGPAPTKHVDILWAAARLFAAQGVAQTSTREIAAAAGTTERTLFKHYGSKERLVQAVIDQAVMPHLAPATLEALRDAITAHAGDFAAWHRALLEDRARAHAGAPELTRLLMVELLRDDALRERFSMQWREAAWKPLTALFARLQREGTLAQGIPCDTLARMFLALNLGYLVGRYVLAPGAQWDDAREIEAITTLFARAALAVPPRG